jgi:hypothetical protein
MINYLPVILAVLPFMVFLFLLFIKKVPLIWSSVVTLILYTILAVFYWQMLPSFFYISYGKGFFVGLDIFIARLFPFKSILAFDINETFVTSCRAIHIDDNRVTISIKKSQEINIDEIRGDNAAVVIIPDWPHENIQQMVERDEVKALRYAFRDENHSIFYAMDRTHVKTIQPNEMLFELAKAFTNK